jgi:hypothetical protein
VENTPVFQLQWQSISFLVFCPFSDAYQTLPTTKGERKLSLLTPRKKKNIKNKIKMKGLPFSCHSPLFVVSSQHFFQQCSGKNARFKRRKEKENATNLNIFLPFPSHIQNQRERDLITNPI